LKLAFCKREREEAANVREEFLRLRNRPREALTKQVKAGQQTIECLVTRRRPSCCAGGAYFAEVCRDLPRALVDLICFQSRCEIS